MQELTIPFALSLNSRGPSYSIGSSAKDEQLINGFVETSANQTVESKTAYAIKRNGSTTSTTLGTSPRVMTTYSDATGLTKLAVSLPGFVSTLYQDSIAPGAQAIGTMSGTYPGTETSYIFPDGVINGVGVVCFTESPDGYYLFNNAITTNFPTFTGDTHTNTVIDNIASTTGIYVGQLLTGSGIQAGTRVASITSATAITVTIATTATAAGVTITKEAVAKIIDADFPTTAGTMTQVDGFFFVSESATQKIYNSARNDPASWDADDYITCDFSGDNLYFIFRHDDMVVAVGQKGTIEYFRIGQTTTGTVLTRVGAKRQLQLYNVPVFHTTGSYCLADTGNGSVGLFKMVGMEFQQVSDDVTTSIINQMYINSSGALFTQSAIIGSKSLILICAGGIGGQTTSLAYDPATNQFTPLSMATAISSSSGSRFTKDSTNTVFLWATGGTWQDSSSAYTFTARTQQYYINNGLPFYIDEIELLGDTQSSGSVTLESTADDYANYGTIGSFDLTVQQKRLPCGGYYDSNVAFRATHSANTACRLQGLKIKWRPA